MGESCLPGPQLPAGGAGGQGEAFWGPCLPGAIPWGSNSLPVHALQNQLLTKGMVILRDKIHFYEGECGGPPRGPSARTRHCPCGDTWPSCLACAPGAPGGRAAGAARPPSDSRRGPYWGGNLPFPPPPHNLLEPKRAEESGKSLPPGPSGTSEPRSSSPGRTRQDL